ncbi:glycosyltransferase family 4 protein [Microtetraspora sp. AC03309]|uniref:glycosyltransferase family 4 protein n=1 Tax=Microtetraspora sp. AC03309 TaxID=2779376 RepID=UPI001E5D9E78|nr:glycosyltransferase family 4 protein [Microtetraspora sp. AC03309]MCC5579027.1 glycosyltransferase family 4 protein [Microtetraspora sp. AC03309]
MPGLTARPGRCYVVCTEVPPDVVGGLGRYAERMMPALRDLGVPVEVFGAVGRHRTAGTERIGGVTLHRLRTAGRTAEVLGTGRPRTPEAARPPARIARSPVRIAGPLVRIAGLLAFNVRVAARILRGGARSGAVVAVHDWMGCLAGILCRLLGRMPVVFHVHTCEHNAVPRARRSAVAGGIAALETAQARLAGLIVVPSAGMRDELTARGWPAGRLRVVPHGFEDPELVRLAGLPGADRDRLRSAVRRRYLPGGAGRLVVFAGRLSPHKGVHTLIRAVPAMLRERDDLRIVLIGGRTPGTGDDAEVARLIEEEGVGGHVVAGYRFLDPPELFAHFLAADVCAFPSAYEPFGLVAVEAMALGRPVVVGPGYSPEVVGDGAIRCRTDSPEELAAALSRCLDDPEVAAGLARRGAAHVRARYSWARTAETTLAAYAEVTR